MTHTTPELITVPAVTTSVVRGRITPDELRDFFDTSFSTLSATLEAQGVRTTGPAFGLYRDTTRTSSISRSVTPQTARCVPMATSRRLRSRPDASRVWCTRAISTV